MEQTSFISFSVVPRHGPTYGTCTAEKGKLSRSFLVTRPKKEVPENHMVPGDCGEGRAQRRGTQAVRNPQKLFMKLVYPEMYISGSDVMQGLKALKTKHIDYCPGSRLVSG